MCLNLIIIAHGTIIAHVTINSARNDFVILWKLVKRIADILVLSQTKLNSSYFNY